MVNASLRENRLPSLQKHAVVTPLLKKSGLDPDELIQLLFGVLQGSVLGPILFLLYTYTEILIDNLTWLILILSQHLIQLTG